MNKSRTRFALSAWTVAVLCALASTAPAADQPTQFAVAASQMQTLGIQTQPLQSQGAPLKVGFPAQVVVPPTAEQVVSSPVAGLVAQLLVQQNQVVRAGTPLLRLASPELGQLQLQLLQASARATLARQAAQREQALFKEGIIPERRVQEAQAALKEGEAALHQAKAALRLSGMPAATIEQIATSGNPQDSITLSASQAGIVTELAVKPGQRVDPATALLNLVQTDTLWLDIQLPVSERDNWPVDTHLKLAVNGQEIPARILSVSPTVSASSQTVMLRAALEGKSDRLRPGEFVTAELPLAASADSWDVPLAAVAHDAGLDYVFVRSADGFEARQVKITASAGQLVRVQGPLKAGEQIAVSGVVALKGAWLNAKESK
jgi:RND family efflux transporter MFP subunit